MKLSDFDYDLPPERIAQEPCTPRDAAKLLVHEIGSGRTTHRTVRELPELFAPGDVLVLNDTKVLAARIFAHRESGARVELLFLEPKGATWSAMVQPAKKPKPGERLLVGNARILMIERLRADDGSLGPRWRVAVEDDQGGALDAAELFGEHGELPTPPYVRRSAGDPRTDLDRERYQTVFARNEGAVAAPTAGLHFTPELLERCEARGVALARVTLHVGAGTFLPVLTEDIEDHRMHAERFELTPETAATIRAARASGGRVICVGTTSVRTLESCLDASGEVQPGAGETRIFLHPGSAPRVTDALLTNFHLPKSTLLMLVASLCGRERMLALYAEAIAHDYRFYSYGDAMLLLP